MDMDSKVYDFVIIGGAQAGLAMAYQLQQLGKEFIILDGEQEIGASWLNRWDSLKLFTPTEYNHLPGLKFKAPKGHYPSKHEVANYFKTYVDTFEFPIQLNTLVTSVRKEGELFWVKYADGSIQAKHVIVATGPFHTPYTPACHQKIAKEVLQLHSNYYKSIDQLQEGDALVVGGGDSGYQILNELSADGSRMVYFSGDTTVKSLPQQFLGKTLWWWFTKLGLLSVSKYSWLGKKISTTVQPVIGTDVKGILARPNVIPVGRTQDADGHTIEFEKETVNSIQNIIWATGYRPNFSWIANLTLDADGYPENYRGVSNIEGLYFIGLPWMHTRGSATLGGVAKDAAYVAQHIAKHS